MNITRIMMVCGAIAVMAGVSAVRASSATTVVVHPADMLGWSFAQETATGTGEMVAGPATTPLGLGSAQLTVAGASGGMVLGKADYQGTRLDEITTLEYSTYRSTGSSAVAIALQFNIDPDLTDANEAWQGRLVYEPYYTETVLTGEWQTWDAMTQGKWWGTGAAISAVCSIGSPCTWSELLTAFPNAGVHNTLGAVLFKAGSGWSEFDGNVDAFTIGVNGNNTTYDFELEAPVEEPELIGPPTTKDECKNGGWMTFNNPEFKNQGQCVSFVTTQNAPGKNK